MSASRIAEWRPQHWPLKQAIAHFASEFVDLIVLLRLAVFFVIQIYSQPLPVETRDPLFTAILDSLAVKPGAVAAIRLLQVNLSELFGPNEIGAQQSSECLRRWLDSHSLSA